MHLRQTTILKFTHQTGSKLSELIQKKKKKKKRKKNFWISNVGKLKKLVELEDMLLWTTKTPTKQQSFHDMDWLTTLPTWTLALINSLCLARFSEDDLDCSTVFDHKSFYAVITRPKHKIFFSTCYIISPHALRNANRKVTLVAINNT